MRAKQQNSEDRENWNKFVAGESHFALLQSWEWGEFKEKLGWIAYRVTVERNGRMEAGAQMLIKPMLFGRASVAYIPRGPVGNWLDEEIAPCLFAELHRIARNHKAIFLKIEPPLLANATTDRILGQYQFVTSPAMNQPRATIILDLTLEEENLLSQMRKKTRQYVRRSTREDITVRRGCQQDLPAFYELMRETSQREKFPARSWDYYKQEWETLAENDRCVVLLAYHQDRLIAVRTAYCFGVHAAEFHGGSVNGLENLHPNYLLVWEAMKWAKDQGCQTYDLWGIPNDIDQQAVDSENQMSERTDGLWGVYRFKRGFSKNVVTYVGAYDFVYIPILYSLIANRLFGGDTLEQISVWLDRLRNH